MIIYLMSIFLDFSYHDYLPTYIAIAHKDMLRHLFNMGVIWGSWWILLVDNTKLYTKKIKKTLNCMCKVISVEKQNLVGIHNVNVNKLLCID